MNLEMSLLTSKTWLILGEPWGCRFFTMSFPLYLKILINCYFKEKLLYFILWYEIAFSLADAHITYLESFTRLLIFCLPLTTILLILETGDLYQAFSGTMQFLYLMKHITW